MNNVIFVRPGRVDASVATENPAVSPKLVKSALNHLLAFARTEGLDNTAMTLELALTAVEVDYEERRAG